MENDTVFLFTPTILGFTPTILGFTPTILGHAPEELQQILVKKFLILTAASGQLPGRILFYTDGVKLACTGSGVLDELHQMAANGVELILCKTCLDYFGLTGQVQVGIVGGMPDIIETLQQTKKVITL
jgi:sulfur relay (sulfurtransferase) complex TusBCD TusD component (DsrE family)